MGVRDIVRLLTPDDRGDSVRSTPHSEKHYECRDCGLTLSPDATECPECGGDIAVLDLS